MYLDTNKILRWNDDGEIVHKGNIIKKSNILQLVEHAIQNDKSTPKGMKLFYKTLGKNNIPKELISNKVGLNIINKMSKQDIHGWRPPGRLK